MSTTESKNILSTPQLLQLEDKRFYVYIYYNPLKDNEEFYVGFGGDPERFREHVKEAKRLMRKHRSNKWIKENCDNSHKLFTIIKILKAGLEPTITKVLENLTKQEAINEEIRLIAYHGRSDKELGPLTNMTDGGEGNIRNAEDLTGRTFNNLTILKFAEKGKKGKYKWLCRCTCGNEKIILGASLKSGNTKSCGCLQKEKVRKRSTKHGLSETKEYSNWYSMINKCNNPTNNQYKDYGDIGIIVCERWLESFETFLEDVGKRPTDKHILDRIDKIGDFEPNNCKWATRKERANNRRYNKYITIGNERKSIIEWCEISKTKRSTITNRLIRNWSPEEAVFGRL